MNIENLNEILNDEKISNQLNSLKNKKILVKFPSVIMIYNLILEFVKPEMLEIIDGFNCSERVVPLGNEKVVLKTKIFKDNSFIFGRNDYLINKKYPKLSLLMSCFNDKCYITANELVGEKLIESYYLFDYDNTGKLQNFETCTNGEKQELSFKKGEESEIF